MPTRGARSDDPALATRARHRRPADGRLDGSVRGALHIEGAMNGGKVGVRRGAGGRLRGAVLVVTFSSWSASGCAPDDRMPLEDCDVGLYWADCGGNDEPLLACERASGDCRWFSGGATARGHAVSNCPTTDPCCHDGWPFTDYGPSGAVLDRVRDQMAVHLHGPETRSSAVEVSFDLTETTTLGRITCADVFPGCLGEGARLERSGSSVVVTFSRGQFRWELEVVTGATWGMHLYRIVEGTRDAPPVLGCYHYSHAFRPTVEGTLHVSTEATDDLDAFHGRFEGMVDGIDVTMEF